MSRKHKIAVIGLGYVGLPLARLFATKYPVVGFDINQKRIAELTDGIDSTQEISTDLLKSVLVTKIPFSIENNSEQISAFDNHLETNKSTLVAVNGNSMVEAFETTGLYCSSNLEDIRNANVYIVTVPTPIDKHNRPDLTPLYRSSETVGKVLKKKDIVIYESTVYPGVTEEECVPVLEKVSGLKFNIDFFVGYSPERINPGDKEHTVEKILKVTSGSNQEIGKVVDNLYKSVITAGTHLAPTIKVAEASKVIENSQRDLNIGFMNELAKIFSLMDIDTHDVLEAAGTKWNFLKFKPGLVGGHCIGVDPFYLAQKAQEIGYYSELILAARRLNDSMGAFVASQVVKLMIKKDIKVKGSKILNLGITFKENCPDIRNSKAIDVITNLQDYGAEVITYDPWADSQEVFKAYGIPCYSSIDDNTLIKASKAKFDAIILTVAHQEYTELNLNNYLKDNNVVYDVKGVLSKEIVSRRL
jgi:UDP-N-acetyl-D-galactosamine dehydrogenase